MAVTQTIAVEALLALAVAVAALSCAGLVAMRTPLQRLHYLGPIGTLSTASVALAVAFANGPLPGVKVKAITIALIVIGLSPVLVHELGRAALARGGRPDA